MEVQKQILQERPEQISNFGSFKVFSIIKKSHNNYGIKTSDYLRYRNFCSNKIRKLRKSFNYKYGTKTKYLKKDIVKDNNNDKKILEVALYYSEKYWAEANQTKYSPTRKSQHKPRARFISIKKLKKAINWSDKLCKLTSQRTTSLTTLQANAYKFYLQGMLAFQQQNWNQAQVKLIAARQIMDELIKTSTSIADEILRQKIDQFDQTIKFCNFKISKGKDMPISQIIEMKKLGDANLSSLIENLTQQRLNQISLQQNKDNNQISFGNQRYPIKQQKIQVQKSKIDSQIKNLQQIKQRVFNNADDQQMYQELLLLYSNIVVLIEQTTKITDAQRETGKKQGKYNQAEVQVLKKVSLLFQYMKISLFIDRSYTIFKHSYNTSKQKKSPPQTLSKLLTAISNNFLQLSQIIKQKHLITGTSSIQEIKSVDQKAFYLRTLRLLFVGQVYFNNDKIKEAFGLWSQCQRSLRILQSKQEMKNQKQKQEDQKDPLRCNLVEHDKIERQLKQVKLKCIIKNYKNQISAKNEVTKMVDEVNINSNQKNGQVTLQYLIQKQDQGANIPLQKLAQIQIIKLPGNLQPVPPRPIFFDIYETTLQYPNVQGKIKKSGWFGGWTKKLFK